VFTWDAAKAARNLAKHGVSFESALDFDWATSVVVDRTRRSDGERRQAAIGWLGSRLHTVIFTDRVDGVRLISFRRANRAEARTYEAISSGKNETIPRRRFAADGGRIAHGPTRTRGHPAHH
jgi:uncharacterized DUF497 family protein